MLWPIFIPSKGRPDPRTARLLQVANVPFQIVLEKQDLAKYPMYSNALILPESNQGIAYVRNFIKERATKDKASWYWMFDDDISAFGKTVNGKIQRTHPKEILLEAQSLITKTPFVGQAALEYAQFSWAARGDFTFGYCDVAVAINTRRTRGIKYRSEMNLKEDRDFTLQVASAGNLVMRLTKLNFAAPKNGSNKGGLYDEYRAGKEKEAVQRMVEAWPGVVTSQVKKDGRFDCKINWKLFRPK